jgi:hypothetical protein
MGEKRNPYRILVGKPVRKRPLGRPRRRWVDNIKIDVGEMDGIFLYFFIWFVRLLALRPFLAYCATLR